MRLFLLFLSVVCITSCRKDKPPVPGKALLLYPANNEVCADGNIISATQSAILLRWREADHTDTYTVTVKNLETGALLSKSTDKTQLEFTLDRNLPYSWFVVSKNEKATKDVSSDVWKFYNPGPAVTSYSPFPADLLAPKYEEIIPATTEKITLTWACTDADGDLVNYDVYLNTSKSPALYKAGLTETSLADIVLERSKTYYWKIVAKDSKGNKSHSDVYTFKLN